MFWVEPGRWSACRSPLTSARQGWELVDDGASRSGTDYVLVGFYEELVLSLQEKDITTMNDYYEVRFDLEPCSEDACDLLAGMLAEKAYESFVPDSAGLTAYVRKEDYSADAVSEVIDDCPFDSRITTKPDLLVGRDWNAEW